MRITVWIKLTLCLMVLASGAWFFYDYYIVDYLGSAVYETSASGPEECTSLENYDAERQVCFFECESDIECAMLEQAVDHELLLWLEAWEEGDFAAGDEDIDDEYVVASYDVLLNEQLQLANGEDNPTYIAIWHDVAKLSPDKLSNEFIETYQVFDNASDDTLAFVDDADGNGKWRLGVNLSQHLDSSLQEQTMTIIHELGHIISLNYDQVEAGIEEVDCQNFAVSEGCSRDDSYLHNFAKKFYSKTANHAYEENLFVTEYAATNEVEDWAESFAFFVVGSKPLDNSVKSQKINYFYNYESLVTIRQNIRNALTVEVLRAKNEQP